MLWIKKNKLTEENLLEVFSKELFNYNIQIEPFNNGAFIINLSSLTTP